MHYIKIIMTQEGGSSVGKKRIARLIPGIITRRVDDCDKTKILKYVEGNNLKCTQSAINITENVKIESTK